jgi:hypothetical protein
MIKDFRVCRSGFAFVLKYQINGRERVCDALNAPVSDNVGFVAILTERLIVARA